MADYRKKDEDEDLELDDTQEVEAVVEPDEKVQDEIQFSPNVQERFQQNLQSLLGRAVPKQPTQGLEEERYKRALDEAKELKMLSGLTVSRKSGTSPLSGLAQGAQAEVESIEKEREYKYKNLQQKNLEDDNNPDSEQSLTAQAMMGAMVPGIHPEKLRGLTATKFKTLHPYLKSIMGRVNSKLESVEETDKNGITRVYKVDLNSFDSKTQDYKTKFYIKQRSNTHIAVDPSTKELTAFREGKDNNGNPTVTKMDVSSGEPPVAAMTPQEIEDFGSRKPGSFGMNKRKEEAVLKIMSENREQYQTISNSNSHIDAMLSSPDWLFQRSIETQLARVLGEKGNMNIYEQKGWFEIGPLKEIVKNKWSVWTRGVPSPKIRKEIIEFLGELKAVTRNRMGSLRNQMLDNMQAAGVPKPFAKKSHYVPDPDAFGKIKTTDKNGNETIEDPYHWNKMTKELSQNETYRKLMQRAMGNDIRVDLSKPLQKNVNMDIEQLKRFIKLVKKAQGEDVEINETW